MSASILGLIGITFALRYGLLLAGAAIMGFFLLAAGPIGFQYGAEVTYPAPEGTTTGLLLLVGQVSGIIFILGMDQFKQAGYRLDDLIAGRPDRADDRRRVAVHPPARIYPDRG